VAFVTPPEGADSASYRLLRQAYAPKADRLPWVKSRHLYRQKVQDTDDEAVEAIGTLSRRTQRLIDAHTKTLPAVMPEAPMFRNRSGRPYTKDTLSRDFRKVRAAESPGAASCSISGDPAPSKPLPAMSIRWLCPKKMANSIDRSKRLQDTYIPKRASLVRLADEARRRGCRALRENES
jgi:hypothetical protein